MTAARNSSANGRPNKKRTWVAPAVPSVAVSSRWVAFRTVWLAAAITVDSAQSQSVIASLSPSWPDLFRRSTPLPAARKTRMPATRAGMTALTGLRLHSRRLSGRDHVVHVHVGGELPAVGQRMVDHAGFVDHPKAALLERDLELVRGDELLPLMGAAR